MTAKGYHGADDKPTRCQSKAHIGEEPPAALATYDLKWWELDENGEQHAEREAVRRLCSSCRETAEKMGVQVLFHRFP